MRSACILNQIGLQFAYKVFFNKALPTLWQRQTELSRVRQKLPSTLADKLSQAELNNA